VTASGLTVAADVQAEQRAEQEEECGEEGECLGGLPFRARGAVEADVAPGKGAAAVDVTEPVDQNTESGEPAQAEDEVGGNMQHVAEGRDHPDESGESGEDGEDNGVDFASTGWAANVDEVCNQTHDDNSRHEFREAEDEREEA